MTATLAFVVSPLWVFGVTIAALVYLATAGALRASHREAAELGALAIAHCDSEGSENSCFGYCNGNRMATQADLRNRRVELAQAYGRALRDEDARTTNEEKSKRSKERRRNEPSLMLRAAAHSEQSVLYNESEADAMKRAALQANGRFIEKMSAGH